MTLLQAWFTSEFGIVLSWWLLVTLAGVAVLPLCWRVLSGLPDKGYSLARTVGLMLVGFVFWLLASFGFLPNTSGSMILSWAIVLVFSVIIFIRNRENTFDSKTYFRENRWLIITTEILFFTLFLAWSIFRAYQNDTATTEKPMELAFISGIMQSESFPPLDPWLSGYSISYYYFGYVMSAMLGMLSNVSSTIAFSLTTSLLFALTSITSFGVVYNLVRSRAYNHITRTIRENAPSVCAPIGIGLLAMLLVSFVGNFQFPLIEIPYQTRSAPEAYFDFWGTQARSNFDEGAYNQTEPNFVIPEADDLSYWWWFRAARVLTDYNLDGSTGGIQPIDEFPQFSFLLSDNHPHVLALPFVIMTIGLALNLLLTWRNPNRIEIIFYGIAIGGLIFLNTWDGPIYLIALVGVDALRRLMRRGYLAISDWIQLVQFGFVLLIIAVVAYLPFFIGFRSQAAGVLPNLIHPTLFRRYFIMFGPLLLFIMPFIGLEIWRGSRLKTLNWRMGIFTSLGIFGVTFLFFFVFIVVSSLVPQIQTFVSNFVATNGGWDVVLPLLIERRITYGFLTVFLLLAVVFIVARLFPPHRVKLGETTHITAYPLATGFALLLVAIGVILTFVPDFVFLRDNFSSRINTVFKFYYQAWIVFALASAYATYTIFFDNEQAKPHVGLQTLFGGVAGIALVLGLSYPVYGIYHRMFVETGRNNIEIANQSPLTLDGGRGMLSPNEYEAVMCLNDIVQNPTDTVVAEAALHAYNPSYGRVGTLTGIPILLGWPNHQRQWRGNTYNDTAGTRQQDLERLYSDLRWDVALQVIQQYNIDYIVFGQSERATYEPLGEEKFIENLELVCDFGDAHIYRVSQSVLQSFR